MREKGLLKQPVEIWSTQSVTALLKNFYLFCLFVILAGCAHGSKKPAEVSVAVPRDDWWPDAARSADPATRNLAQVRERINAIAPIRYKLGISDQPEINAFATKQGGRTLVVFTKGFIQEFGNDPDVLATTLGHELAHHQLGHTDPNRQKDKKLTVELGSQLLGTIANIFVPFSGLLVGPAVQTASLGFDRSDERDADLQGLQWAYAAGYSPCGSYRFSNRMTALGKDTTLVFLSTHPGNSERADNAQAFATEKGLPSCTP